MLFLLLPLISLISLVIDFDLSTKVINWTLPLQSLCAQALPESKFQFFTQSLVCGIRLDEPMAKNLFLQTGLLHLVVVSGAHLIFLEQFLKKIFQKIPQKAFIICIFLFIYSLFTGFKAPVARALTQYLFNRLLQIKKFYLTQTQTTHLSGWFLLILFPEWADSISLLLSWSATFVLSALSECHLRKKIILSNTLVYLFIIPYLISFTQIPHPTSILFNSLISPIIGATLLPLGILSIAIPPLSHLSDWLLYSLFTLLDLFSNSISGTIIWIKIDLLHQWWIFFFLTQTYQFISIILRRKSVI